MTGIAKSLLNQRFYRLLVIARAASLPLVNRGARWVCQCDCGETTTVRADSLKGGHIRSCGCLNNEQRVANLDTSTHGHAKTGAHTRTYLAWENMRKRCYKENARRYSDYGGRGITVCDRWRDSFENFLADMGECPGKLTLDRSNNNGNYEPGNCKWVTMKEQNNNRRLRRDARLLTWYGESKQVATWIRDPRIMKLGLSRMTLEQRLLRGWSHERTLTTPKACYEKCPISNPETKLLFVSNPRNGRSPKEKL